jgi:Mn-dependent DtxR family transcriptional regulator
MRSGETYMETIDYERWCRTPAAKAILAYVADPSKPTTTQAIADATGYMPSAVASVLSRLRRFGYVERPIVVTAKGKELINA